MDAAGPLALIVENVLVSVVLYRYYGAEISSSGEASQPVPNCIIEVHAQFCGGFSKLS